MRHVARAEQRQLLGERKDQCRKDDTEDRRERRHEAEVNRTRANSASHEGSALAQPCFACGCGAGGGAAQALPKQMNVTGCNSMALGATPVWLWATSKKPTPRRVTRSPAKVAPDGTGAW